MKIHSLTTSLAIAFDIWWRCYLWTWYDSVFYQYIHSVLLPMTGHHFWLFCDWHQIRKGPWLPGITFDLRYPMSALSLRFPQLTFDLSLSVIVLFSFPTIVFFFFGHPTITLNLKCFGFGNPFRWPGDLPLHRSSGGGTEALWDGPGAGPGAHGGTGQHGQAHEDPRPRQASRDSLQEVRFTQDNCTKVKENLGSLGDKCTRILSIMPEKATKSRQVRNTYQKWWSGGLICLQMGKTKSIIQ